jgi:hypothetical protein
MKYAIFEHGGRERVGLVDTAAGLIHPRGAEHRRQNGHAPWR